MKYYPLANKIRQNKADPTASASRRTQGIWAASLHKGRLRRFISRASSRLIGGYSPRGNKLWLIGAFICISGLFFGAYLRYYHHPFQENDLTIYVKTKNKNIIQPTPEITPDIRKFGIKIDKISILTPVIKNVDGLDKKKYFTALQEGAAHYKGTSLPGEKGNVFIFGHSSSSIGTGPYADIFAKLNKLEKNDLIIVFYEEKEYIYKVNSKKIIEKDDIGVLNPTTDKILTLMTCWPIGTNEKRLIIRAILK